MSNKVQKELKEKLKQESDLVRESSMEVLKEFEAIERFSNDLAKESKNGYWTKNKSRFIKPAAN